MNQSRRILSTKLLEPPQKERLLAAGFAVVEMDFVTAEGVQFETPEFLPNLIITSKNAAKALKNKRLQAEKCFCVGEKTAALMKAQGYTIACIAPNAASLAAVICENYASESFYFLGTASRRDELPTMLAKANIPLSEITVYKTIPQPHKVDGEFDGILFFSPSGVTAFTENNSPGKAICFCIGPTTAASLPDTANRVVIAKKPGVEYLVLETVNYFKTTTLQN